MKLTAKAGRLTPAGCNSRLSSPSRMRVGFFYWSWDMSNPIDFAQAYYNGLKATLAEVLQSYSAAHKIHYLLTRSYEDTNA
jgi:hypothetical protein